MGSLSLKQEIVMVVFSSMSSIFSITGSTMILIHLYYRYRRTKRHRFSSTNTSSIHNNTNTNNNNNDNNNPSSSAAAGPTSTSNNDINTATENGIPTTTVTAQQPTLRSSFYSIRRRMGVPNNASSTNHKLFGTTDRRLIFLMSFFDLIQSTATFLQPYLLDTSNSHYAFGYGTYTTCHIVATVHHISLAGGLYACMLNFYYLLTVRYSWTQRRINQSHVEWYMHLFAIGTPLSTGIAGAIIGFWGNRPFFMGCWVGEYPPGCEESNGAVPCRQALIGWMIGVLMYMVYLTTVFVSNTLLFLHVRKISKKSLYWGFQNRQQRLSLLPPETTTTTTTTTPGEVSSSTAVAQNTTNAETQALSTSMIGRSPSSSGFLLRAPSSSGSTNFSRSTTFNTISRQQSVSGRRRKFGRSGSSSEMMGMMNQGDTSSTMIGPNDIEEIHRKRLRRVGMQGVYYVCAGLLVYFPWFITQDMLVFFESGRITQSQIYGLLLIQAALLPLDGFFNAIIFFRPRFLDIRYNQRTGAIRKSVLETLWICVFGESRHSFRYYRRNKSSRSQRNVTVLDTSNPPQQQQEEQQPPQQTVDNNSAPDMTAANVKAQLMDIIDEEPDTEQTAPINKNSEHPIENQPIDTPLPDGDLKKPVFVSSEPSKCSVEISDSEEISSSNFLSPPGQSVIDDDADVTAQMIDIVDEEPDQPIVTLLSDGELQNPSGVPSKPDRCLVDVSDSEAVSRNNFNDKKSSNHDDIDDDDDIDVCDMDEGEIVFDHFNEEHRENEVADGVFDNMDAVDELHRLKRLFN